MLIEEGRAVEIGYELKLNDGRVVDSASADEPLMFIFGAGLMLPAFEKALKGKKQGDEVAFTLSPEEGYGARDEQQVMKMPRTMFPAHVAEGMIFEAETPEGEVALLRVAKVGLEEVTVDGNHPMAGETLNFSVNVVAVREPTEDEMAEITHEHGEHCNH
jgi:FKBP-type peptidyl-prolyl cis-trans isomerase SlyD